MRTTNNRQAMRALASRTPRRGRRGLLVAATLVLAVIILAGAVAWLAHDRSIAHGGAPAAVSRTTTTVSAPLTVVATSPAAGAQGVPSNMLITISFSTPLPSGTLPAAALPTLDPPVTGTWHQTTATALQFAPSAPFIPATTETLTIPGGPTGLAGARGQTLSATDTLSFTIAPGSEERLEQLLALTGYLPLTFTASGSSPPPGDLAMPETGTFAWRWPGLASSLTALWVEGQPSAITEGAVMALENQDGLSVDAIAGPAVWAHLLSDVQAGKTDPAPYTYVYVSKVLPENLTLWVNGVAQFQDVPVNTGVPGADTADGTFEVFEHVTASEMKGTNPDGSTYDDPDVPWASYFNGGDALHGFVRATYGSPQSNGCVEMSIADAGATWPYTPIGTLVTIDGPAST